ncbi:unnamed protein product [Boreogadus saida]
MSVVKWSVLTLLRGDLRKHCRPGFESHQQHSDQTNWPMSHQQPSDQTNWLKSHQQHSDQTNWLSHRFQGDDDGPDLNPCLQISVEIRCATTTSGTPWRRTE